MKTSTKFLLLCAMLTGISAFAEAQQNYKIRQTITMNGQKSETTTYVKGLRKRSEGGGFMGMGGDVADVEQCDLKRNLKISDKKKMYAVEPFDDGMEATSTTASKSKIQNPKSKIEKGGVVTYVSNITDTGERKQMFGLTARHIKTSMSMEASPDACAKMNMKTETDGWYVDLPEFSCPIAFRPQVPQMGDRDNGGGCRDQIKFRTTGGGKLGFPLAETRTMKIEDAEMTFTQTLETLEFSKATLDAALFDIPQGYTLTGDAQSLYGKPDMSAMMRGAMGNSGDGDDDSSNKTGNSKNNPATSSVSSGSQNSETKKPGMIRIGVYVPTNKGGEAISTTNMQMFLVQKLTSGNVEAVGIASETDARSRDCDYVLTSDFSKLKQSASSKIGGMFGKVTNTDTSAARNYEAQLDFRLTFLPTGEIVVQSKANSKGDSDVDRTAENAIAQEAIAVLKAATAK